MVNVPKETFIDYTNLFFVSLTYIAVFPTPFLIYYLIKKNYQFQMIKKFSTRCEKPEYVFIVYLRKLVYSLSIVGIYGYPYI